MFSLFFQSVQAGQYCIKASPSHICPSGYTEKSSFKEVGDSNDPDNQIYLTGDLSLAVDFCKSFDMNFMPSITIYGNCKLTIDSTAPFISPTSTLYSITFGKSENFPNIGASEPLILSFITTNQFDYFQTDKITFHHSTIINPGDIKVLKAKSLAKINPKTLSGFSTYFLDEFIMDFPDAAATYSIASSIVLKALSVPTVPVTVRTYTHQIFKINKNGFSTSSNGITIQVISEVSFSVVKQFQGTGQFSLTIEIEDDEPGRKLTQYETYNPITSITIKGVDCTRTTVPYIIFRTSLTLNLHNIAPVTFIKTPITVTLFSDHCGFVASPTFDIITAGTGKLILPTTTKSVSTIATTTVLLKTYTHPSGTLSGDGTFLFGTLMLNGDLNFGSCKVGFLDHGILSTKIANAATMTPYSLSANQFSGTIKDCYIEINVPTAPTSYSGFKNLIDSGQTYLVLKLIGATTEGWSIDYDLNGAVGFRKGQAGVLLLVANELGLGFTIYRYPTSMEEKLIYGKTLANYYEIKDSEVADLSSFTNEFSNSISITVAKDMSINLDTLKTKGTTLKILKESGVPTSTKVTLSGSAFSKPVSNLVIQGLTIDCQQVKPAAIDYIELITCSILPADLSSFPITAKETTLSSELFDTPLFKSHKFESLKILRTDKVISKILFKSNGWVFYGATSNEIFAITISQFTGKVAIQGGFLATFSLELEPGTTTGYGINLILNTEVTTINGFSSDVNGIIPAIGINNSQSIKLNNYDMAYYGFSGNGLVSFDVIGSQAWSLKFAYVEITADKTITSLKSSYNPDTPLHIEELRGHGSLYFSFKIGATDYQYSNEIVIDKIIIDEENSLELKNKNINTDAATITVSKLEAPFNLIRDTQLKGLFVDSPIAINLIFTFKENNYVTMNYYSIKDVERTLFTNSYWPSYLTSVTVVAERSDMASYMSFFGSAKTFKYKLITVPERIIPPTITPVPRTVIPPATVNRDLDAAVGGVVGGIAAVSLIAGVLSFLVLRMKKISIGGSDYFSLDPIETELLKEQNVTLINDENQINSNLQNQDEPPAPEIDTEEGSLSLSKKSNTNSN